MVHKINNRSQEFAHIRFDIIRTGQQLRPAVGEVRSDYFVEIAFFIEIAPLYIIIQ